MQISTFPANAKEELTSQNDDCLYINAKYELIDSFFTVMFKEKPIVNSK